MENALLGMDYVKTNLIVPDEAQPRKYFNAEKMRLLTDSIKREGIISPLVVEKVGEKFLLVDGERRFRAASSLGLKEVPVVIEKPKNAVERLVRQFTVQEQHEAWTPIEKAQAIMNLSQELGISLPETCQLLNVSPGDTRRYAAFAVLVDKEHWVRNEVPLSMAENIRSLRATAIRVSEERLKKEFTRSDEKRLERRVVQGITEGSIKQRSDITKIGDSITKDPKSLAKWLQDEKVTSHGLFLETGAQGANALRNVMYNARYITTHGARFLSVRDVEISDEQVKALKTAKEVITKMISLKE